MARSVVLGVMCLALMMAVLPREASSANSTEDGTTAAPGTTTVGPTTAAPAQCVCSTSRLWEATTNAFCCSTTTTVTTTTTSTMTTVSTTTTTTTASTTTVSTNTSTTTMTTTIVTTTTMTTTTTTTSTNATTMTTTTATTKTSTTNATTMTTTTATTRTSTTNATTRTTTITTTTTATTTNTTANTTNETINQRRLSNVAPVNTTTITTTAMMTNATMTSTTTTFTTTMTTTRTTQTTVSVTCPPCLATLDLYLYNAPRFHLGPFKSENCGSGYLKITSDAACMSAAAALNLIWNNTDDCPKRPFKAVPTGCYKHRLNGQIFNNQNQKCRGIKNTLDTLVCQKKAQCLPGKYAPNGLVCKDCIAGKFTEDGYQKVCSLCAAGKFVGKVEGFPQVGCEDCGIGKYAENMGQAMCKDCPSGRYVNRKGAKSLQSCLPATRLASEGTEERPHISWSYSWCRSPSKWDGLNIKNYAAKKLCGAAGYKDGGIFVSASNHPCNASFSPEKIHYIDLHTGKKLHDTPHYEAQIVANCFGQVTGANHMSLGFESILLDFAPLRFESGPASVLYKSKSDSKVYVWSIPSQSWKLREGAVAFDNLPLAEMSHVANKTGNPGMITSLRNSLGPHVSKCFALGGKPVSPSCMAGGGRWFSLPDSWSAASLCVGGSCAMRCGADGVAFNSSYGPERGRGIQWSCGKVKVVANNTIPRADPAKRKYTLLWYVHADNDMEKAQMEDIYEIMRAYFNHGDPATFAVNILIDREAPRPADRYFSHESSLHSLGNFNDSRSFILGKTKFEDVKHLGELNMDAPATLEAFIRNGTKLYPAEKYIIILSDHGYGLQGGFGMDSDDTTLAKTDMKAMAIAEMAEGIKKGLGGKKFALMGIDACLMQHYGVTKAMAPHADFFLASEDTEPDYGWNYEVLRPMFERPFNYTIPNMGKLIADGYLKMGEEMDRHDTSLGLLNTTAFRSFDRSFTDFVSALRCDLNFSPEKVKLGLGQSRAQEMYYAGKSSGLDQNLAMIDMGILLDRIHKGWTVARGSVCTSQWGYPCQFPFIYKDKSYNNCTDVDNGGELWCSTSTNSDNAHVTGYTNWGVCTDACLPEEVHSKQFFSEETIIRAGKAKADYERIFSHLVLGKHMRNQKATGMAIFWPDITSNCQLDAAAYGVVKQIAPDFAELLSELYLSAGCWCGADALNPWKSCISNPSSQPICTGKLSQPCSTVGGTTCEFKGTGASAFWKYSGKTYRRCAVTDDSAPWCSKELDSRGEHVSRSFTSTWDYCSNTTDCIRNCTDKDCRSCGMANATKCTMCDNSKYLTVDGACVQTCPAGFNPYGAGKTERYCSIHVPPTLALAELVATPKKTCLQHYPSDKCEEHDPVAGFELTSKVTPPGWVTRVAIFYGKSNDNNWFDNVFGAPTITWLIEQPGYVYSDGVVSTVMDLRDASVTLSQSHDGTPGTCDIQESIYCEYQEQKMSGCRLRCLPVSTTCTMPVFYSLKSNPTKRENATLTLTMDYRTDIVTGRSLFVGTMPFVRDIRPSIGGLITPYVWQTPVGVTDYAKERRLVATKVPFNWARDIRISFGPAKGTTYLAIHATERGNVNIIKAKVAPAGVVKQEKLKVFKPECADNEMKAKVWGKVSFSVPDMTTAQTITACRAALSKVLDVSEPLITVLAKPEAGQTQGCKGVPPWASAAQDTWCDNNCNHVPPHCPASHCSCLLGVVVKPKGQQAVTAEANKKKCKGVPPRANAGQDKWCNNNCNHVPAFCPASHCNCPAKKVSTTPIGLRRLAPSARQLMETTTDVHALTFVTELPLSKGARVRKAAFGINKDTTAFRRALETSLDAEAQRVSQDGGDSGRVVSSIIFPAPTTEGFTTSTTTTTTKTTASTTTSTTSTSTTVTVTTLTTTTVSVTLGVLPKGDITINGRITMGDIVDPAALKTDTKAQGALKAGLARAHSTSVFTVKPESVLLRISIIQRRLEGVSESKLRRLAGSVLVEFGITILEESGAEAQASVGQRAIDVSGSEIQDKIRSRFNDAFECPASQDPRCTFTVTSKGVPSFGKSVLWTTTTTTVIDLFALVYTDGAQSRWASCVVVGMVALVGSLC